MWTWILSIRLSRISVADRRYIDEENNEWDSRYEYEVYRGIQLLGFDVRRCSEEQGDTFAYQSPVVRGRCLECEGNKVVQERTYTPDLYISGESIGPGCGGAYIEAKGYWKAPKRNLLRSVVKSNPDLSLLFIFQRDLWVTKGKSKYSDYIARFFKDSRCLVWNNNLKNPGPVIPADFFHFSGG